MRLGVLLIAAGMLLGAAVRTLGARAYARRRGVPFASALAWGYWREPVWRLPVLAWMAAAWVLILAGACGTLPAG